MKSLTVRLPGSIVNQIEEEASVRGVSKSEIVRERLEKEDAPVHPEGLRMILEESWTGGAPLPPQFHSPKKKRLAALIRAKKLHR